MCCKIPVISQKCPLWLGSSVFRVLVLRLNGREFDPGRRTIGRLILGWVTVFRRAYRLDMYVTSHPGQTQPPALWVRERSTGESAVMRCGWE